jgi:cobalt/nickel transport system permease protein
MHISEGVLKPELIVGGFAVSAAIGAYTLRKIKKDDFAKVSLLSACFFISSVIHIPVPPTSIHLIMGALIGIILGSSAFIAILIGLVFQALMFQHGGILALGVNAFNIGFPAFLVSYMILPFKKNLHENQILFSIMCAIFAFAAIMLSALFTALELVYSGGEFTVVAKTLFLSSVITGGIEAVVTFIVVRLLLRIKPAILGNQKSFSHE